MLRGAMSKRPTLSLKPREGRRARLGAPWIFSNEVQMDAAAKALPPGVLVDVKGDDGQDFGTGYFNPKSLIAVRLLSRENGARVDAEFFAARVRRALTLREALYAKPFYRLVHAEGDGLPGLTIDRFGDVLVVQITTAGMEALLHAAEDGVGGGAGAQRDYSSRRCAVARAWKVWTPMFAPKRARPAASRWKKIARAISPISARAKDRLVLRPAGESRLHRGAGQRQNRAGRLFLYWRLRHRGGARGRQGSRVCR